MLLGIKTSNLYIRAQNEKQMFGTDSPIVIKAANKVATQSRDVPILNTVTKQKQMT